MNRIAFLVIIGLLVAATGQAMYEFMELPELVKNSNLIVIAKVVEKTPGPKNPHGGDQIRNSLLPERVLKGEWKADQHIVLLTFDSKGKWREDKVTLPEPGERVILFLKKAADSALLYVNRDNSVWPLKNASDTIMGPGWGMTIQGIETEIATQGGSQGGK
jgi:hypothetical protein